MQIKEENNDNQFRSDNLSSKNEKLLFSNSNINTLKNEKNQQLECFKRDNEDKTYLQLFDEINKNFQYELQGSFQQYKKEIFDLLKINGYCLVKYLSKGGQGIVFVGYQLEKKQEDQNAMKKEVVFKIYFNPEQQEIKEEIEIMKVFEKKINIITLLDYILGQNFAILVIEKCRCSLQDELQKIIKGNIEFTIVKLFQMFLDLLDGLLQMRIYNIIHLDIKPDNILVTDTGYYIYTDFGCSSIKKEAKQIEIKGYTKSYAPEEVQNGSPTKIDFKSDVYSLGKLLDRIIQVFQDYSSSSSKISQAIQNFQKIISENMLNNKIFDRKECKEIQGAFFKEVISCGYKEFLDYYYNKISQMTGLFIYDNNKDIFYYQQLQVHYLIQQYEIAKILKQNTEQIAIIDQITSMYLQLSDFTNALKFSELSLARKQEIYGNTINQSLASSLFDVGRCYKEKGDYPNALKYSLESIEMAKQLYNQCHADKARFLEGTALIYSKLGDTEKALNYTKDALYQYKQLFNGNNSEIAKCLNGLGNRYSDASDMENAIKYSLESLEMRKSLYHGIHRDIAASLYNVCNRYNEHGEFNLALEYSLESYEMIQQIFKGNHIQIALSLDQLGITYKNLGQFGLSLKYQIKSLEMRQQLFEGNHHDIAQSMHNVGNRYLDKGDFQTALKYSNQSQQMRRELFKGNHLQTAKGLTLLGQIYVNIDYEQAIKCLKESLDMTRELYQGNHDQIYLSLYYLGNVYREFIRQQQIGQTNLILSKKYIGYLTTPEEQQDIKNILNDHIYKAGFQEDYQSILQYLLESFNMVEILYKGENHFYTSKTLNDLGVFYRDYNELSKSHTYLNKSLIMKSNVYRQNHPEMASLLCDIGIFCLKINDFKNAKQTLNQSYEIRKQLYEQIHPVIAESLYQLGILLYKQQQYKNALDKFQECYEMRKKIFSVYQNNLLSNTLFQIVLCYIHLEEKTKSQEYFKQYIESVKECKFIMKYQKVRDILKNKIDK